MTVIWKPERWAGKSATRPGLAWPLRSLFAPRESVTVHQPRRVHEEATRLYADRTDDRGRDHRYPGGHRYSGLPGLHGPFQSDRTRERRRRLQDDRRRVLPGEGCDAFRPDGRGLLERGYGQF